MAETPQPGEGNLLLASAEARDLPAMVRSELAQLSQQRQEEFLERFRSRRKSRGWAWLLWFLGWQFAYFREWGLQILFLVGLFFVVGLVWWVVEAFKVNDRVRQRNAERAIEALRDLKGLHA